jgi:uncharacterized membrane protein
MDMKEKTPITNDTTSIKRIGGYLHRVIPITDATGKVLSHFLKPVMVEFRPRDLMQVVVGASVLAVPVAFTEETWSLGEELPFLNVMMLSTLSMIFIGLFVYLNFYRYMLRANIGQYVKRVFSIYFFSLLVVGVLLTIIQRCPWGADNIIALKRILIVAFPASMSAALSDSIK